mmetsp:Transcript_32554/g.74381  ORF Transcript_32554/g.74381 Transcript_32554/m.74381 type:complete len:201 (-) Transcript_32554:42-644(-)
MQSGALCARRWSVQLILQDPLPRKVPAQCLHGKGLSLTSHLEECRCAEDVCTSEICTIGIQKDHDLLRLSPKERCLTQAVLGVHIGSLEQGLFNLIPFVHAYKVMQDALLWHEWQIGQYIASIRQDLFRWVRKLAVDTLLYCLPLLLITARIIALMLWLIGRSELEVRTEMCQQQLMLLCARLKDWKGGCHSKRDASMSI